jgi:putative intracellular protease/amidase
MTMIVTILTEGYADWETALLNAAARSYFNIDTRFATPGGRPVTSSGGLKVMPDLAVEDIDVEAIDALVVNGGAIWSQADAPDIGKVLVAARDAGKTVAGICDGTLALAKAGLLDDIAIRPTRPTTSRPPVTRARRFTGTSPMPWWPVGSSPRRARRRSASWVACWKRSACATTT